MLKKLWGRCKYLLIHPIVSGQSQKLAKAVLLIFALHCISNYGFAEVKNDSKSSALTMPTMPQGSGVTMPSVGSGFYSPGRNDFYAGTRPSSPVSPKNPSSPQKNTQSNTKSQTSLMAQTKDQESQNSVSTATDNARELNRLAKAASGGFNQLTAGDISSMSNLGAFSQISGLLGRKTYSLEEKLLEAQNTVTASTADSATLKEILAELTQLKEKMADSNGESVSKTSERKDSEHTFANIVKKEPKILRFTVNGYDLLTTCKKIYFSEIETDGTFLLTGDRKYMSENKAWAETFYFYFHAVGTESGITKYTVTPAVSQDYENEYSYLYQLTQKNELTADRTGNLVTLRSSDGKWKMDMLISLDK